MPRHERQAVILALVSLDAAMLLWAAAGALGLRYGIAGWPGGSSWSMPGLALFCLTPLLTQALLLSARLYQPDELFSGHREYAGVARAATYAAFAALALSFLLEVRLSRGALVLGWALSCLLLGGGRFLFRRLVFSLRRRGRLARRALIVGADEHAVTIARRLAQPASGWQVLGFLDDYQAVGAEVADGLRVVGDPCAAPEAARELGASDLILVPHAVSWEAQRGLLELAATSGRPALHLAPGLYHLLAAGTRPLHANDAPLLTLERLRITGLDALLKAGLDYALSAAALPALGALLAALALAARLSGGGALLKRHPALGLQGRRFDLLAFAPPSGQEPEGALRWRCWRLRQRAATGRWSKLPNVWNVLAGRMSLIGPRALPAATDLMRQPWARTLLLVRPGFTGPCPPTGADWSVEEQAIHDVSYVRGYSLWADLRLLVAALRRALRRERALPPSYVSVSDEALAESLAG